MRREGELGERQKQETETEQLKNYIMTTPYNNWLVRLLEPYKTVIEQLRKKTSRPGYG